MLSLQIRKTKAVTGELRNTVNWLGGPSKGNDCVLTVAELGFCSRMTSLLTFQDKSEH